MDQDKEYRIRIEPDYHPEDPREWGNLGTMVCWHQRYGLGDEQPTEPPDQYFRTVDPQIIGLPLYLLDHSGITMNTTGFHCPWDSGQVGWIYVTKAKVREEFGWERITAEREQQVLNHLRAEVEIYDQYLRGDIYSFVVESRPKQVFDAEGNPLDTEVAWDIEDSCSGFYGVDPFKNGMADHIDEELHGLLRKAEVQY